MRLAGEIPASLFASEGRKPIALISALPSSAGPDAWPRRYAVRIFRKGCNLRCLDYPTKDIAATFWQVSGRSLVPAVL